MAKKKASARRRQQALKNARRDGRVTGAEAKKLKNLGVSKKKITNTQRGKVKVSSAASRQTSTERLRRDPMGIAQEGGRSGSLGKNSPNERR